MYRKMHSSQLTSNKVIQLLLGLYQSITYTKFCCLCDISQSIHYNHEFISIVSYV